MLSVVLLISVGLGFWVALITQISMVACVEKSSAEKMGFNFKCRLGIQMNTVKRSNLAWSLWCIFLGAQLNDLSRAGLLSALEHCFGLCVPEFVALSQPALSRLLCRLAAFYIRDHTFIPQSIGFFLLKISELFVSQLWPGQSLMKWPLLKHRWHR